MFFRGPRADNRLQGQSATGNNAKTKKTGARPVFCFGATDQIRTGDLLITNQLLYRLSHSSIYYSLYRLEAYGLLTTNQPLLTAEPQ